CITMLFPYSTLFRSSCCGSETLLAAPPSQAVTAGNSDATEHEHLQLSSNRHVSLFSHPSIISDILSCLRVRQVGRLRWRRPRNNTPCCHRNRPARRN